MSITCLCLRNFYVCLKVLRRLPNMNLSNTNYFIFTLAVTFLFFVEYLNVFNWDLGFGANSCLWPFSNLLLTNSLYLWVPCSTRLIILSAIPCSSEAPVDKFYSLWLSILEPNGLRKTQVASSTAEIRCSDFTISDGRQVFCGLYVALSITVMCKCPSLNFSKWGILSRPTHLSYDVWLFASCLLPPWFSALLL